MEPTKRSVCQPRRATAVHQRLFGDSARVLVGERGKLLDVGVSVTPVTKQHGDRRAAAHRLGLRQIGHVEPNAGRRVGLDLDPSAMTTAGAVPANSTATSDGKNHMTTRANSSFI